MILAVALVAVPFLAAGAGIGLGGSGQRRGAAAPVAVAAAALATVLALALAVGTLADGAWRSGTLAVVPTGTLPFGVTLLVDGLGVLVAVAVTVVALLVQIYSVAYLRDDPRYPSYAALVSLFTAAMLLVVLAGDLLVLYVGWEVMGICSYFLVGHYWERPEARAAAVKAFLTTRIGDILLLFGIFAVASAAGSFRIETVLENQTASTVALLLVLGGAVGKSAQFPLHVWLPDAMAGPTPVSALIHAATMVAAGVFLVLRLWPLFVGNAAVLAVLGVVAAVTMVGAALAALAQEDLKRVLAWSTVSQLALMFGALAVAAPAAALLHLLTHAAFKGLLFLCAGAVMHAVGTSLMSGMGGLRRALPVTFATMTIGLAALVGLPPVAGFFSKESVLTAAEEAALHGGGFGYVWTAWLVLVAGLLTVALTAAYSTRLLLRTFFGPSRAPADAAPPHEAPAAMRWPLVALAVPTGLLGLLALPAALPAWVAASPSFSFRSVVFAPVTEDLFVPGSAPLTPSLVTTVLSLELIAAGSLATYALWRRRRSRDPARVLGRAGPVLAGAFGVDTAYARLVVAPVRGLARLVVALDRDVIDAYVRGSGRGADWLAGALRRTQQGNVQRYLTVLLAGVVIVAVTGAVRG